MHASPNIHKEKLGARIDSFQGRNSRVAELLSPKPLILCQLCVTETNRFEYLDAIRHTIRLTLLGGPTPLPYSSPLSSGGMSVASRRHLHSMMTWRLFLVQLLAVLCLLTAWASSMCVHRLSCPYFFADAASEECFQLTGSCTLKFTVGSSCLIPSRQASSLLELSCPNPSPPGECYLYVCEAKCEDMKLPPGTTTYRTVQAALDATTSTNVSLFLDSKFSLTDASTVPTSVEVLHISTYTSISTGLMAGRASLGPITMPSDQLRRSLTLSSLKMEPYISNCFGHTTSSKFDLLIDNSQLTCSMNFSTIQSRFYFGPSVEFLGHATMALRFTSGSLTILSSHVNQTLHLRMGKTTSLKFSNSDFFGNVTMHLNSTSSHLLDQNTFNASLWLYSDQPDPDNTVIRENSFFGPIRLQGGYIGVNFIANIINGTNTTLTTNRPNHSLLVAAKCLGNVRLVENRFRTGTLYIEFPTSEEQDAYGCAQYQNPYKSSEADSIEYLEIKRNHFLSVPWITPVWEDVLLFPVMPVVTLTMSGSGKWDSISSTVISATQNFWDNSTGPWLCCNPEGTGSYVDRMVNTSDWCIDQSCEQTSKVVLAEQCIQKSCPLVVSESENIVFMLLNSLSCVLLFMAVIMGIVQKRIYFTQERFQNEERIALLDRVCELFKIIVSANVLCALSIIAMVWISNTINNSVAPLPRQERFQMDTVLMMWIIGALAVIYMVCSILNLAAIVLRPYYPAILEFTSSKFHFANLFILVFSITFIVFFIPMQASSSFSLYSQALVIGKGSTELTIPSPYSIVPTLTILPFSVMVIASIIPGQILNTLLYFYEYSKITTVLEKALLRHLADSPKVKKQAFRIRLFTIPCFILAILLIIVSSSQLRETLSSLDNKGLEEELNQVQRASRTLPPMVAAMLINTGRWLSSIAASVFLVIGLGATVFITFSYQRVAIITFTTSIVLLGSMGAADNFILELIAATATKNRDSFSASGFTFAVCTLTTLACILLVYFLWKLRENVLEQLPVLAISNLNNHLDDLWQKAATSTNSSLRTSGHVSLAPEDWHHISQHNTESEDDEGLYSGTKDDSTVYSPLLYNQAP